MLAIKIGAQSWFCYRLKTKKSSMQFSKLLNRFNETLLAPYNAEVYSDAMRPNSHRHSVFRFAGLLVPVALALFYLFQPGNAGKTGAQTPPAGTSPAPAAPDDGVAVEGKRVVVPIQEIIARVDQSFRFGEGILTGRLTAVTKSGSTALWDFSMYNKEGKRLFHFSSSKRGLEAKILYREDGEEIWLWDAARAQLFRKRDYERFQPVLGTGFSYIDLSGYSLQANYNGSEAILYKTREAGIFTRLSMRPIISSEYGKMVLLADQEKTYRPIRIDFHDRQGIMFKTMRQAYGEVLMKATGKSGVLPSPNRLEVLHLTTGMITRFEVFTYDDSRLPNDTFFDPDYLNR